MENNQQHPKLQGKPVYQPTGRKATPKMLDFLAFRLIRKGYKVSRWTSQEIAV